MSSYTTLKGPADSENGQGGLANYKFNHTNGKQALFRVTGAQTGKQVGQAQVSLIKSMRDLIVTQDYDSSGFDCVDVLDDCASLADQVGPRPKIKATRRQRRSRQHVAPLGICA
jgi:hypothetical protein